MNIKNKTKLTLIICYFLLFNTINSQVLDVPLVSPQQKTNWCWAGCSQYILEYYSVPISQCQIVEYSRSVSYGVPCPDFGQVNCLSNCSDPLGCNSGNLLYGICAGDVKDVLYHFGGIESTGSGLLFGGTLSLSEIETEISNQRPFIMGWTWTGGGGGKHALVGHGIIDNDIYFIDPGQGYGYNIADYEWIKNGVAYGQYSSSHTWDQTLTMDNSPNYYCTDNFESNNNGSTATQVFASPLYGNANYSPTGTNLGYAGDQDWFRIDLQTQGNLQINLSNLPFDYNLFLYSDVTGLNLVDQSNNDGVLYGGENLIQETVTYNNTSSNLVQLYAKVAAANGSDHWTASCYNIQFSYTASNSCSLTGITPNIISPGTVSSPGSSVNSLTPTLSWSPVSGATDYNIYIKDLVTNTFILNESCATPATNYQVPTGILSNNGLYKWYVKANNICESCISNESNHRYFQTQINSICPLTNINPTIVTPGTFSYPGQTLLTSTPTLTWNEVPNAGLYGVYIRDLVTNLLVFDNNCNTPDTSFIVPNGILVNGGHYRWNIIAKDSCGSNCVSHYATPKYFNIQTSNCILSGIIPTLASPGLNNSPGESLSDITPTLIWNSVVGATNYNIYVLDLVSNSLVLNEECASSITNYTIPNGILSNGGFYKWFIKANINCDTCNSYDSYPLYFQINTSCNFNLSPTSASFSSNGGSTYFSVNTTPGCNWAAISSSPSWITIINENGTGNGNLIYSISNNTGPSRIGYIYLPGNSFTIYQAGTSTPEGLFWVGNSGNWSDGIHWSNTSGGSPCYCVPTLNDNVYFDSNSFNGGGQSIIIDQIAYCKSMDWTGAISSSTLSGYFPLNIYGSLVLNSNMNVTYTGQINFKSNNPGNIIQTFNKSLSSPIYFDALGGEWTLQDNLSSPNNIIYLTTGSFNTNSKTVIAYGFESINGNIRFLTLGASTINLSSSGTSYYNYAWNVLSSNLTLNSGTSTINLTGSNGYFYAPYSDTYFDLNFTGSNSQFLQCGSNSVFHNVSFNGFASLNGTATYNNVSFLKDASLNSSSSFNNLSFAAGKTYTLANNSIFTLNGVLSADGNCATPTQIFSNSNGTPATFSKSSGTVVVNYLRLKDITANGGATFTANNCTDFGNNNGWTINSPSVQNLYWIGNGGNWTDANHWSFTSGGPSSGCIPTPYNNVYFDSNSFNGGGQSVIIDQIAYCKSMDWTGALSSSTLSGYSPLNIYGSLVLNSNMNVTYTGQINFKSNNPGNIIQTFNKSLSSPIYFDALGGEWTLQDNLNSPNNIIYLTTGAFNTNSKTVNAYGFESINGNIRFLTLGASTINLSSSGTSYYNYAWNVLSSNLTLNSGTSTINLTGSNGYFYAPYSDTYFDLNFTGVNSQSLQCGSNSTFHNVTFNGTATINGTATYNNVSFLKDANLNSSSTFNNLNFAPGKTYTLANNSIFTLNGVLSADGNCATPTQIFSNSNGTPATFSKSSGTVVVNYLRLKDITANGGATFTANNTTDLGNNNGWVFTPFTSQNFYWVGNGGNWIDGNHWSFTSGGPSSGCIPSLYDNVYFDSNSFSNGGQSVIIDQIAYCKSMDWTGVLSSSTLSGYSPLNIYGSLVLNSNMNVTYTGQINFKSNNPGNIIQTFNKSLSSPIYFDALGGEWTLQDNLSSPNNIIYLTTGSFNTNSKTVNTYGFESINGNIRFLTLGASTINLSSSGTSYYNYAWNVLSSNLTLNSGTSTINLTGSNGYFYAPYSDTYFDVNFTGVNSQSLQCGSNSTFHNVTFNGTATINGTATYNNVSFLKDANLNSSSTFNNLNFAPGKTYTLANNSIFTLNGVLSADGNCATPTQIFSNSNGTPATFSKFSGTLVVNYLRLKDITANGGATFTANNCTDFGNNNGWTINSPSVQNLYWIGNGGNWTDANHWSFTSGGPSSGCIPTPYNNVYFDSNSFNGGGQSVIIDQIAYCKSMDWTGALSSSTLSGYSPLNIYGSLVLNSNMNVTYTGQINFKSNNPGNIIQTFNKSLSSPIYFDALGGEWTLQDNLNSPNNIIYLTTGSFNTNNKTVNAYGFESINGNIRFLTLGASTINLSSSGTSYYNYAWNVFSSNLTLNSGTSTINLTGSNGYFYAPYSDTYFDLNFTGVNSQSLQCGSNSTFHNVTFNGTATINGTATYNNVSFLKDANLNSSSTFNNLNFAPGKTYTLANGTIQNIINNLYATGNTGNLISIACTNGTSNLIKTSGSVCLDFISLQNIQASGGGYFFAGANSNNLNGNIGWSFTSCSGNIPQAPFNPMSNSPQCNFVQISRVGNPPPGVIWYWQGVSCGTSTTLGSGPIYLATSSGTYYQRAYDPSCSCWSEGCGSVEVIVNQSTDRVWLGEISSDWFNGNNWTCGTAPNPDNDVTIPANTPFSPIINYGLSVWCKSLNIMNGANLIIEQFARLNIIQY